MLLLRSSSAAEITNPYSHNDWYQFWGQAKAVNLNVPGVEKLCIPVKFSKIDFKLLENPPAELQLGIRVTRSGQEPAELTVQKPWEIFSPVIYKPSDEEWMLGFYYDNPPRDVTFQRIDSKGFKVVLYQSSIGIIAASLPLEGVQSIEFFCHLS